MTAQLETLEDIERETLPPPTLESRRFFPGVPAGAASGLAILAVLHLVGRGLALTSPPGESGDLTAGSVVWWLIAIVPAAAMAGAVAGILTRPANGFLSGILGLVTWSLGLLLTALFLSFGAANLLGGVPSFLSGYARFPGEVRYGEFTAGVAWVVIAGMLLSLVSTLVGALIGSKARAS